MLVETGLRHRDPDATYGASPLPQHSCPDGTHAHPVLIDVHRISDAADLLDLLSDRFGIGVGLRRQLLDGIGKNSVDLVVR